MGERLAERTCNNTFDIIVTSYSGKETSLNPKTLIAVLAIGAVGYILIALVRGWDWPAETFKNFREDIDNG
jgi:hypothetical protein